MNVKNIIRQLQNLYPGKNIIENKNKDGITTEIICETEPTSDHPDYDKAIAVIDQSSCHYHLKTTEEYLVLKGKLTVVIDGEERELFKGQNLIINPGQCHSAKGDSAWIECVSRPGWTPEDQIAVK